MNNRGVTLIELMVVVAIIGILIIALAFSYQGWQGRYKVEGEIKNLYTALIAVRSQAIQLSRTHFMDISPDGRFYRVTQDDSEGDNNKPKPKEGDGIFQEQAPWAAIQASSPTNWGTVANGTDTTVTTFSRKIELSNNPATAAGLLSARGITLGTYGFVLGFDNRGLIRNMTGMPPVMNIANAAVFPANAPAGSLSICIFSDYDPDYDCINITETGISMGKLRTQNTATPPGACDVSNCISK